MLVLAREMKLLKLGHIALDGTKIKANASKHTALSWAHANKIEAQLRQEVQTLLALAEKTDRASVPDGMDVPAEGEIARREDRNRRSRTHSGNWVCCTAKGAQIESRAADGKVHAAARRTRICLQHWLLRASDTVPQSEIEEFDRERIAFVVPSAQQHPHLVASRRCGCPVHRGCRSEADWTDNDGQ